MHVFKKHNAWSEFNRRHAFNVINMTNQFVYTVSNILYRLTEPALQPIRRFMPNLGGLDVSPVILLLLLYFVQSLLHEYWPHGGM